MPSKALGLDLTPLTPSLVCPSFLSRYHDTGDRFPHLANAFKYSLSMIVTVFGTFVPVDTTAYRVLFTTAYVFSTLYSWSWDIFMDWSVIDLKQPGFIRERRMVQQTWTYYFAIVADLVLRFFWVWTLMPERRDSNGALVGAFVAPFAAIAEIFRRTMWSVFRLENEHVHDAAKYRKTAHIPLQSSMPLIGESKEHTDKDKARQRNQILFEITVFVAVVVVISVTAIAFV